MDYVKIAMEKVEVVKQKIDSYSIKRPELALYIDHTLLAPYAVEEEIQRVAEQAYTYGFKSVCINPYWVKKVSSLLAGHDTLTCSVIGFPLGASRTEIKVRETNSALLDGANEFDMVINIGLLKDKKYREVELDIKEVVKAAGGKTVKVIIEACYLTSEEKIQATEIVAQAGAEFVKTSTGFGKAGATVFDVALLSAVADENNIKVKAAGGIHSYKDAISMIIAGAKRIGASHSIDIIKDAPE